MSVQHISTRDAYNQWASVYDTDGNMLQAIDDLELEQLLPELLNLGSVGSKSLAVARKLELLDLGCGTGRNTAKLLTHPWAQPVFVRAIDFSSRMLDIAEKKLLTLHEENKMVDLMLNQADCFPTVTDKSASPVPNVEGLGTFDIVISTLVLEHVPLQDYFATLAVLVKKGGYALVTNMHSEMGRISQAGFVNAEGVKVRGTSFAHTPEMTVEAAREAGFEIMNVKERTMTEADVKGGRVSERGWKWVGTQVWYGLMLRRQ
ncbi:hypothetical protein GRF29_28g703060 [Pseudopithomyces chartarum]|uniref:Methyltransferase type 12 domain-containing protein n=1 Tax=Pseudopithomyces chartarum TaxID=1892770 RepID=A0AAN6M413_9PLEO|nr:hypothetical protein GRF29_28g703060 [Pseudopithomyces chartarum]